ncbi:uncharacterized protein LOC119096899 [Pollicipes pollicipes]|uniref:uncharacterized protein LOC119096899 n=1 Tax=Pollicipes pollicipes TaxID=41117 RepID=UPI001884F15C|nr:uncharacterized protein LOC119096899 [Pollicipes pollicipes]
MSSSFLPCSCRARTKAPRSPAAAADTAASPRSNWPITGASWPDCSAEENSDSACWNWGLCRVPRRFWAGGSCSLLPIDGRNCCSLSRKAGLDSTGCSASAVMADDRSTSPPAPASAGWGTFMLDRMLCRSLSWTAGPAAAAAAAAAGMAQTEQLQISRAAPQQPWGFRLQGGKDFNMPIIIQKVNGGSPAERAGLRAGDAVISIGGQNAIEMRHKEAQDSIVRSGNNICMVVQRAQQRSRSIPGLRSISTSHHLTQGWMGASRLKPLPALTHQPT